MQFQLLYVVRLFVNEEDHLGYCIQDVNLPLIAVVALQLHWWHQWKEPCTVRISPSSNGEDGGGGGVGGGGW